LAHPRWPDLRHLPDQVRRVNRRANLFPSRGQEALVTTDPRDSRAAAAADLKMACVKADLDGAAALVSV